MGLGGLVGRDAEIEQVRELVSGPMRGPGRMVVIEGEPGAGKSLLMDLVAAECRQLGMGVHAGAAEEMEQRAPLSAIFSCLGSERTGGGRAAWITSLLDQDAPEATSAAADAKFAVTEAILDLMERRCAEGPQALILDDLQWADRETLQVLHRLALTIAQLPLLVVLAVRQIPRRAELELLLNIVTARGAVTIPLGPLESVAVAGLVEQLTGAPPGEELLGLVAGAAGNPLYITEVVAALTRDGRVEIVDGTAQLTGTGAVVTPSLAGAILRRLDFLSLRGRDLLRLAAVLGPDLEPTELSVILAEPAGELASAMREAVDAGLLKEAGGRLSFRHDLIRAAMAEQLPATARGALHLQAAHALAEAGGAVGEASRSTLEGRGGVGSFERVAQHLLAGDTVDGRSLEWLTSAAEPLVAQAPALAADLIERAFSSLSDNDCRAPALRLQQVRALLRTGRPADAEQAARVAVVTDQDPSRAVTLRWLLAQACFQQGHVRDAYDVTADTLASIALAPAETGRFQLFAAECRLVLGEVDLAHEEAAAEALLAGGHPDSTPYALFHLAGVRYAQERMPESLDLLDRSLAAFGSRMPEQEWHTPIDAYRGILLLDLDRGVDAEQTFKAGLRRAERHGSPFLTWYHMGIARVRYLDGRWDDALAEVEAGLETLNTLGEAQGLNTERGLQRQASLIAIHRGDSAAVAAIANAPYVPGRSDFGDATGFLALWAQALAWEAQGRPQPALASLFGSWDNSEGVRQQTGLYYLCPDMARLAVTLGEPERARPMIDDLRAMVERQPTPTLRGIHHLSRGLVESDPESILNAAELFAQAGRPLYQALANENAAAVLAQRGATSDARARLRASLELYAHLDATWDAARAQARLRAAGVRSRTPSPPHRARTGWDSLTDTERKVAELVARGHSNPDVAAHLYISRRTVQTHVSSIMTKLDCTSRVEVAVVASRHAAA